MQSQLNELNAAKSQLDAKLAEVESKWVFIRELTNKKS